VGIWENGKYLDGKQYILTGTHEALFIKIWTQDAGFFVCLSGIWKIVMTQIYLLVAMQGFHKTGVGM